MSTVRCSASRLELMCYSVHESQLTDLDALLSIRDNVVQTQLHLFTCVFQSDNSAFRFFLLLDFGDLCICCAHFHKQLILLCVFLLIFRITDKRTRSHAPSSFLCDKYSIVFECYRYDFGFWSQFFLLFVSRWLDFLLPHKQYFTFTFVKNVCLCIKVDSQVKSNHVNFTQCVMLCFGCACDVMMLHSRTLLTDYAVIECMEQSSVFALFVRRNFNLPHTRLQQQ